MSTDQNGKRVPPATDDEWSSIYVDAATALNTPSGLVRLPATTVMRLITQARRLREGLRQVAEEDFPADAGLPGTWAREVLDRPESVLWETEQFGRSES